jgi:quinol monooxygenase YgiN
MEILKPGLSPFGLNRKVRKTSINITAVSSLRRGFLLIVAAFALVPLFNQMASAQDKNLVVRVAKLQIDPAQLENYKSMLKEAIETAIRIEPGVLTLYAVYEKEHPTQVTIFEIYANADAYKAHLQTPHFKKYKSGTQDMVKALELVDVAPIALASKAATVK